MSFHRFYDKHKGSPEFHQAIARGHIVLQSLRGMTETFEQAQSSLTSEQQPLSFVRDKFLTDLKALQINEPHFWQDWAEALASKREREQLECANASELVPITEGVVDMTVAPQ